MVDYSLPTPLQESFLTNGRLGNIHNDPYQQYQSESKFSPLMLFADYGMMATPSVGRLGSAQFKLLTTIGMEVGTYAPAHKSYNPIVTGQNQGFTTGWGPQLGSGFAVVNGPLTMYSLGTFSHGDVVGSDLGYRYNSVKVEAGIRYGDLINLRYTSGKFSWQTDNNREANIQHQLTIGIILDELHN